jgi:hypothetical protein
VLPFVQTIHGFPLEAFPGPCPIVQCKEEKNGKNKGVRLGFSCTDIQITALGSQRARYSRLSIKANLAPFLPHITPIIMEQPLIAK